MQYYEGCYNNFSIACADGILDSLGIKNNINKCMKGSVKGNYDSNKKTTYNSLLQDEREKNELAAVPVKPAVFINDNFVRGSMNKIDIFDEICNSFNKPPGYCKAIIEDPNPKNWNVDIDTGLIIEPEPLQLGEDEEMDMWDKLVIVASVLGILILVALLIYCCGRKMFKSMLNDEIKDKINKYQEFKDKDNDIDQMDGQQMDDWHE